MNRNIRGMDINYAPVLHMEEIAPGDWRGVDAERSAGISRYTWETVITRIADMIGQGYAGKRYIWSLEIGGTLEIHIDGAGNTWIGHEYLAPHQYLPRLIPEKP